MDKEGEVESGGTEHKTTVIPNLGKGQLETPEPMPRRVVDLAPEAPPPRIVEDENPFQTPEHSESDLEVTGTVALTP
ncbi:hypothetical protein NPIL_495301 [Nephila pilipes]|uniref:Uncharacterized protein n=1 Tax=Nephila pilipes TaxID=299642 RepID=A0A8X6P7I5_NEPPI|nr:hypothetical protein NPIL_495301 [Nephila pilipes]